MYVFLFSKYGSYNRLHNHNEMCVTIIIISDFEFISYYHYLTGLTKMPFKCFICKQNQSTDGILSLSLTPDPFEDQFEKRQKKRKENSAKNELQRLRNLARNMKGKGL